MSISAEVRATHRQVARAAEQFIEFVEQNPETWDRANFQQVFDAAFYLVFPQSWPFFVSPAFKRKIEDAGREVFDLIKLIPERIFNNDPERAAEYFNFPVKQMKRLFKGATPANIRDLLARGDFVYGKEGFKCLEYNIAASIGGWSIAFMEPVFFGTPPIQKFMKEYNIRLLNKNLFDVLYEHILQGAHDAFPQQQVINTAGIIPNFGEHSELVLKRINVDLNYKRVMGEKWPHKSGDIFFGGFRHLQVRNGRVFFNDREIDILLIIDVEEDIPEAVMEVFEAGNVLLYDGPISGLLSNKLTFALLSEHVESPLFSPEEQAMIRKYIPWTRKIVPGETVFRGEKAQLKDLLLNHREEMVLKPADGFGGDKIYVGRHTSKVMWKEVVKSALRNTNWLAQEYVQSQPFLFQTGAHDIGAHDVIWGVFVFGREYAGTFLRALYRDKDKKGVINSHQGAEYSVVLEVDE